MGVGLYLSHQLRCKYLNCIDDTWRAVSEDPLAGFLLIVRTGRIVTAHNHTIRRGCNSERVPPDTRMSQHTARFTYGRVETPPL
jgi:hypothetical protein